MSTEEAPNCKTAGSLSLAPLLSQSVTPYCLLPVALASGKAPCCNRGMSSTIWSLSVRNENNTSWLLCICSECEVPPFCGHLPASFRSISESSFLPLSLSLCSLLVSPNCSRFSSSLRTSTREVSAKMRRHYR